MADKPKADPMDPVEVTPEVDVEYAGQLRKAGKTFMAPRKWAERIQKLKAVAPQA